MHGDHGEVRVASRSRGRSAALVAALGLILTIPPATAEAQVTWGPMRFSDGSKTKAIPYGAKERVTGYIDVCEEFTYPGSAYRTVTIGEYVTGQVDPFRAYTYTLPGSGYCPGRLPVTFDIPPGPSRNLGFGFIGWGPTGSGYRPSSDTLKIISVARPSLKPSAKEIQNGEQVSFAGAIPAYFVGEPPSLALQVRLKRKWRTFKVIPVRTDGGFSGVYRFKSTLSSLTYKFRVKRVPGGNYPFSLSPSKKVRVKVVP